MGKKRDKKPSCHNCGKYGTLSCNYCKDGKYYEYHEPVKVTDCGFFGKESER